MGNTARRADARKNLGLRIRKWAAGTGVGALVAAMLVTVGVGIAQAEVAAPTVSASISNQPVLAGTNANLNVRFANEEGSGADRFNLSFGLTIPNGVSIDDAGWLGAPTRSYTEGTVLRGGASSMTAPQCAALGLELAPAPNQTLCRVPAGAQYFVFENISDLPDGASNAATLSLRPDASVFDVEDHIPFVVSAYTSAEARLLPAVPGGTTRGQSTTHSSSAAVSEGTIDIGAVQLSKTSDQPEDELLRGIHKNQATYTLTVRHTGEGDVTGVEVVDYLPAWLEYLGSGEIDNTENANGNVGQSEEYEGSGPLDVSSAPDDYLAATSVTTVELTDEQAENAGLGENAGGVYTRVAWKLADLIAGTNGSSAQPADGTGQAGEYTFSYRAGVPLFANTANFGGRVPDTAGEQAANLDNNTGASTRQGQGGDPWSGASVTNTASVSGSYTLKDTSADPRVVTTKASDSDTLEVLDVRLLKRVDNSEFQQGGVATYTLNIASSEYVDASLGDGSSAQTGQNRLVDDMGDGVCPIFPDTVPITPGASSQARLPNLMIGDPNLPHDHAAHPSNNESAELSAEEWNDRLGVVSADCAFPSSKAGAAFSSDPESKATLSGIAYNPENGHFYIDFRIADVPAGETVELHYTAAQNANYSQVTGGTSSGDRVYNDAKLLMTTNPTEATADETNASGTGVGEEMKAYDDSEAALQAITSNLTKHVLPRSAGVQSAATITDSTLEWEDDEAPEPFMAGDEVWYRIVLDPPTRANVRNPKLSDMLPAGIELEGGALVEGENYVVVAPNTLNGVGDVADCQVPEGGWDASDWLEKFVSAPEVNGQSITWALGSDKCVTGSSDKYLPSAAHLVVYIKGIVVGASDNDSQDLTQNLVKYQEQSRNGRNQLRVIEFMRDAAGISIAGVPTLVKGIETNVFERLVRPAGFVGGQADYPAGSSGNRFDSDVDGEYVVQGNDVTFRIDVTAPESAAASVGRTTGYVIWDALPVGMTKADLVGGSAEALLIEDGEEGAAFDVDFNAYDPGEAEHTALDLRGAYENRTIVVWNVDESIENSQAATVNEAGETVALEVQRGFSLKYTLTVPEGPDGAVLQQEYVNSASITQYESERQAASDSTTTLVPVGTNTLHDFGTNLPGTAVSSDGTVDASSVKLPSAFVQKRLHATEVGAGAAAGTDGTVGQNAIDAANSQERFVQGELLTYEYTAHIPANTTVRNGVLADTGDLVGRGATRAYTVVGDPVLLINGVQVDGALPEGFELSPTGELRFPERYATGASSQQFSVRLTVLANSTGFTHNTNQNIVNTARFTSTTATGGAASTLQDTANTQFIAPDLGITKTSDHDEIAVAAGQVVEYEISLANAANRPASYDNSIVDTVPPGLIIDVAALKSAYPGIDLGTTENEASLADGTGGKITWPTASVAGLAQINGGGNVTVTYSATIAPTAGGSQSFKNDVEATGYTLPATVGGANTTERRGKLDTKDDATVTAVSAELTKGVRIVGGSAYGDSVSAPIGETVEYEVSTTLYADVHYYDARITDRLPAGVELVDGSVEVLLDGEPTGDWALQPIGPNNQLTWVYTANSGTIAPADKDREITLRYQVLLKNTVGQNVNQLPNTAVFSWGSAPNTPDAERSQTEPDTATVNVLNPRMQIAKTVDGESSVTRNPDATLSYELRVTNVGNTPAHNVVVSDCVPAGIVVNPESISHDGEQQAATADCAGDVIVWELTGPQAQGAENAIVLSYEADFAESGELRANADGLGDALTNVADVTSFESFARIDDGEPHGRTYTPGQNGQPRVSDDATARPLFPNVSLEKSVNNGVDGTGNLAYVNKAFGWKLTLVNNGQGNAQTVDVIDVLPKNWNFDAGSAMIKVGSAAPVALDDPVEEILTSGADAGKTQLTWEIGADLPGSPAILGSAAQSNAELRTIEITFTATPQEGALGDAGVGTTVPHTNTLRAVPTDTRGETGNASTPSYVGDEDTADAFIASADLTIEKVGASAPITAGTSAVAWTIEVSNDGPDTAEGVIGVSDVTSALPAGVVVTDVSGEGWTCDAPVRDAETGETSFECLRTDAAETLASGDSLPLISVTVEVAADQPAVGANVITNTATVVPGATHDDDPSNNESSDDITIDTVADLTIEKTLVGTPVNVGEAISWQIQAWNAGPSVSRSTTENPITISDTVPAGVTGVTAMSNVDWVATLADGTAIPEGGVDGGTTIVWTYQHDEMPTLPARPAAVGLSGTVLTSHIGEISNTAEVIPGPTSEGDNELTNTSTVSTTPTSETSLEVIKERVVADGDGWRTAGEGDEFVAGTDIHYRITVTNNGPADARDVQVVDEVPAGLSYRDPHANLAGVWARTAGGATSEGSGASWDTFTLDGTLAAGADGQFVVTYATAPTVPAGFTNCVEATTENWHADGAERFDRACNDSSSVRVVDLGIVKTHAGTAPFVSGTDVDYTITVTNHGPSASDGPIIVTDELPIGVSYVPGTATTQVQGVAAVASEPTLSGDDNRMLTWSVPLPADTTLLPGEAVVVTLTAHIDEATPANVQLTNRASTSGPENEPTGEGSHPNTTTDDIITSTSATMTIVKDVDSELQIAGTEATYTLTITNEGPSAVAASVTDTLPAGLSFVSMNGDGWNCEAVDGVPTGDCAYSDNSGLHPVGTSTITVVAHIASNVPPTGEAPAEGLVNVAELGWSDSDGSYTDEDDAEIRILTDADLGITKSVISGADGEVLTGADATAIAGRTVWYRLDVANYGPSDAVAPIVVTDVLPEGITVPTTLTTVGAWDVVAAPVDEATNRQTVTFTLASNVVAGSAENPVAAPVIEFEADVAPTVTDGAALVNDSHVSSETPDSNPENDDSSATVIVTREADLEIVKSHPTDDNGQVHIDQPLDFTIQVTNNGPSVATGITVTDTIPAGLEVTSQVGEVLDADGNPTGWTILSIEPVVSGGTGEPGHSGEPGESEHPSDPSDPSAPVDLLGGAIVVASYSGELGITAEDNAATPLVIQTIPRESALGTAPNHVSVTGNEVDPEPENNEFEDPIDVLPRVTLVTTKTAVSDFQVGKVGEYRITVSNIGPHGDPGPIVVRDALPAGLSFNAAPDVPEGVVFEQDGSVLTWTIGEGLAVGETVEFRLLVDVSQAAYPSVSNTVTVDSPAEKTPESVLEDTATVEVAEAERIAETGSTLGGIAALGALLLIAGMALAARRRQETA